MGITLVSSRENPISIKKRPCAVCGGRQKQLLFEQQFFTISAGSLLDGYEVVACPDCGFCFADNIPDQTCFDNYYKEMSKYEYQDRDGKESNYDLVRFRKDLSIIKAYLGPSDTRIFEIGCSSGKMLSLIKESGYDNLMGLDPSPYCREAAERLYGIKVISGTLSSCEIPEGSFDFLLMIGVLEHLCDLGASLKKIRKMLSPGGRLFINVPDASRYYQGEDAPFQEFSIEHLNFFGPISLQNLLSAHGFSQVDSQPDLVEINYRTVTPVIQAIFKKEAAIQATEPFQPDTETELGLITYIQQSHRMENRLRRIIGDIVAQGRPIVVWGAGTHTLRSLSAGVLSQAKIVVFVDSNPRYLGKQLNGIPIISPSALRDYSNYPILISSRGFQQKISQSIKETLGLRNEIILLYDLNGPHLAPEK